MNKAQSAAKGAGLSSITQVIADGVNVVLARPLVLLIPVLLDLYYLLGWRITLRPLLGRVGADITDIHRTGTDWFGDFIVDAGKVDVLGVVAVVIPSFLGGVDRDGFYAPVDHGAVTIDSWPLALLLIAFALVLAAVTYALFGLWLADAGLGRARTWRQRLELLPVTGLRVIGLAGLVLGIAALLLFPIVLAWAATTIAGAEMEALFQSLIMFVVIGLIVIFYFAPDALFVASAGPAEAMRLSVRIVRQNLWPTVTFALTTILLSVGLNEIWERMAENAPGMLLAMLASSLVGCSLAIAAMLFFNERWISLDADSGKSGQENLTPNRRKT